LDNFETFILNIAAARKTEIKISNFANVVNSLAEENAKNVMTTVERYYDYLSSTLKRVSKKKNIYPDLQNSLLKDESSHQPAEIGAIFERRFHHHDINFIKLLINHRTLLNPTLKNSNISSNFARLLLLQVLCEKYNEEIDCLPLEGDVRKKAQKFKRKIYCLLPTPNLRADTKRHFIDLTPQAAAGFFFDFAANNKNYGYINSEGDFEKLSFADYAHVWRFYTDIFNPACRALNLAQNKNKLQYVLTSIRLSYYEVHFVYKYKDEYKNQLKELVDIEKYLKECNEEEREALEEKIVRYGFDPGHNSTVTGTCNFSFFFNLSRRLKVIIFI
jgi:hypothetical protein